MQPLPPMAIAQNQIIQISMVAPTVMKEVKAETKPKKETQTTPLPSKKGMFKSKKESEKKEPTAQLNKEEVKKPTTAEVQAQRLTSGLTAQDATQMNSAITKPVAASYLNNPPPRYPEKARLRRQQGTVLLDVCVKIDGKPRDVRIIKSSGYDLLDKTALQTVELWQFLPARRGNKHVEAHVEVPIIFQIN